MEVMLEIYKSLDSLGMSWKKKKNIAWPNIGKRPAHEAYSEEVEQILAQWSEQNEEKEYPMDRPRPDKETRVAEEKASQNLFLVETRHRYGNVMVSSLCLHMY
jgi:hypothetical protein